MRTTMLATALSLGIVGPVLAQQEPIAPKPSMMELAKRTLLKTFSYQTLSSGTDFGFGYFFGGGISVGAFLVAANVSTEVVLNYAHDYLWALSNEQSGATEAETRIDRTATFTAVNALRVFSLGFATTGSTVLSVGYVIFNAA